MSLERYFAEISDSKKPLVISKLANLSTLSAEELRLFIEAWVKMDAERQRQVVGHLVELAEENPNMNFDDIFIASLHDPDETVRIKSIDGLWECESCSLINSFVTLLREDGKESLKIKFPQ